MESPNPTLQCAVVVDWSSFEHRLGDLNGSGGRLPLDLCRLIELLGQFDVEVVRLSVCAPFVPVVSGVGGNPGRARMLARQSREWWTRQVPKLQARCPRLEFRAMRGGTNGDREVGVDLMVAAAALDAVDGARAPAAADRSRIDAVIVCSHDSDFHHLHSYSSSVPVLMAGAFDVNERELLREGGVPALRIPEDEFRALRVTQTTLPTSSLRMSTVTEPVKMHGLAFRPGDQVLVDETGVIRGGPFQRRVNGLRRQREVLSRCRSVAVVDPYGISNLAVRSIGAGRLPDAASVTDLVESLGWDTPLGIVAVVPDVATQRLRRKSSELRRAWERRDGELDDLADQLDGDDDDVSIARRVPLHPDQVQHHNGRADLTREIAARAIKRLGTGLLADLWLSATAAPSAEVILISEDPDLMAALELLPACGVHSYERVVRIGVHAGRGRVELKHHKPFATRFVLLTDVQLAELARVGDQPHSSTHRRLLHVAATTNAPARKRSLDPETGQNLVTLRVRCDLDGDGDSEEVEVTAMLIDGLKPKNGKRLAVVFDRGPVCAHPVLRYQRSDGRQVAQASVLDSTGSWVDVDIDGDEVPDARIPLGHESLDHPIRGEVTVGRSTGDADWFLVDPAPTGGVPALVEPEIVVVETVSAASRGRDGSVAVSALEDGFSGLLVDNDGEPIEGLDVGSYLYALRRSGANGDFFVSMSTPLDHLRSMLADPVG